MFEFADGSAAGLGACVAAHVRVFDRAAAGTRRLDEHMLSTQDAARHTQARWVGLA
jgi:hypothetical protein